MFLNFDTDHFHIRKIQQSDNEAIYNNWAQEIDVARYTTWVPHRTLKETTEYVNNCLDGWSQNSYTWILENKQSLEIAGAFAARTYGHRIEVGYLLAKSWWGKGIMTDVVSAFIGEAFKLESIERVGAVCDVENLASKRVMEKAGMNYEGILSSWIIHPNISPKARDCFCLGITR